MIAQVLDPSHQPLYHVVAALCVNIGGASVMIRLLPHKDVKGTDHHRVCHGHDRAFPPSARRQAMRRIDRCPWCGQRHGPVV